MKYHVLFVVVAATLAAGCTTLDAPLADGSAARALVVAQTADPEATERNGSSLAATDPERASAAIEAMRSGVAKPAESWTSGVVVGN
jgi:hypothetical protein